MRLLAGRAWVPPRRAAHRRAYARSCSSQHKPRLAEYGMAKEPKDMTDDELTLDLRRAQHRSS